MPAHDRPFAIAKRVPLAVIDAAVCARLGPARVPGNAQPAAFNRQVAMYLAKHVGGWSTTSIGKFYNGRDHSTVCHSIRRVESMRERNSELDALLAGMSRELREKVLAVREGSDYISDRETPTKWTDEEFLDNLVDRIVDRLADRIGKRPVIAAIRNLPVVSIRPNELK
jgi:hypothetical protein